MAHYAKISNEEFTVSERARLRDAQSEKSAIEANNRASEEYVTLKTAYHDSFTSATLQTLEGEMATLQSQLTPGMTEEEREAINSSITAKQAEIDAEKAALVTGQEEALANLYAKEAEGTETLTAEIETLKTTIGNSLCRVKEMNTGADEIEMVRGDTSALDEEMEVLVQSKKDIDCTQEEDVWKAEMEAIDAQIEEKSDQIAAVPDVEKDNTKYWEGYYGGCKRTSYNTRGGVHILGGTPFRKNYAAVGHIYDPVRDAFYVESPGTYWTLDEDSCTWNPPTGWVQDENHNWLPPVDKPVSEDGTLYDWNQETLTWVEI